MTQNTSINQATEHTDYGVAMKIKHEASDILKQQKAEITGIDTASKVDSSAASVYGGIIAEAVAPGLKFASTIVEGVVARSEESAKADAGSMEATPLRSIHEDVELAERAPGVYSARTPSVYGGNPKTATDLSENVLERVELTKASLVVPKDTAGLVQADSRGNLGGLKCEMNKDTLSTTKLAEQLVCEKVNEAAYNSAIVYEQKFGAARGAALGMGAAPSAMYNLAPKNLQALASESAASGAETV